MSKFMCSIHRYEYVLRKVPQTVVDKELFAPCIILFIDTGLIFGSIVAFLMGMFNRYFIFDFVLHVMHLLGFVY